MAILPIYIYGNEVLKKKAKKVSEISFEDITLVKNMFETMAESNGIGLAANQIGVLKQILVLDISEMEAGEGTKPMVVINPAIVEEEDESEYEEGCLSIPDVREKVWRPEKITLQYHDINMEEQEIVAEGLLARVLQHEIDHLHGVLFIDHLTSTKRTFLRSKLKKVMKGEIETTYQVVLPEDPKLKKKKK